jgi:hypothetical protein
MSNHTPGPWIINGRALYTDGRRPDGKMLATLFGRPTREQDANGALMAAAPDLLAALREIVGQDAPNRWGYDCASIALDDDWRTRARAALAKAVQS